MSSLGLKVYLSLSLVFCFFLEISPSSHDPITFSVYHIGHLMRPYFKDYESFVAAILAQDRDPFSRANSSHDHMKGKDRLRTDYTAFPLVARLNGLHVVRVQIGMQRQKAHLLLDTGSSFVWWQCQPCTNCYLQLDPMYDSQNSTSYSSVHCQEKECDERQGFIIGCPDYYGPDCEFSVTYSDGDGAAGILAYESIWSEDGRFSENVIFGCASHNIGSLYTGTYSGILGFGMGPYSFPRLVDATKFSFCLQNFRHSELWDDRPTYTSPLYLNDIPLKYDGDNDEALVLPILQGDDGNGFYRVELVGVSIGDETITVSPYMWSRPTGGVHIDSGTPATWFPPDIYSVFRDKFREEVRSYEPFSEYGFDLCYRIYSDHLGNFPPVSFHFANNSMPLELPREHVMTRAADGEYCLAFHPNGPDENPYTTILGSYQLQGVRQTYDLSKRIIRLFPFDC